MTFLTSSSWVEEVYYVRQREGERAEGFTTALSCPNSSHSDDSQHAVSCIMSKVTQFRPYRLSLQDKHVDEIYNALQTIDGKYNIFTR